jgi:Maltose operon periplasmic protein precursor (MalM)
MTKMTHLGSAPASTQQPRLQGWRSVCLLVTLAAVLPAMAIAIEQDAPDAAPRQETPTSIARLLAGRKAFVELTRKGKVKRDIKMDDQSYAMADGPSRVVLLKLPDYQEPYALTIKSYQFKRAFSTTFGVFVPTIVVLDADFAVTRTVPENALKWESMSMMKGARLEARLPFTELQNGERFVLLHTRGHFVGRPTLRPDLGPNVPEGAFSAKTTADGSIEAETGPITKK